MNDLLNYTILEQLFLGDRIVVSRALRNADNHPVVLKMLRADYPDPSDIARLSYEYDLLKGLSIPEMVHAYAYETFQNRFALVLENVPNSMTLRAFMHTHRFTIDMFLRLAILLADALDKVHELGIIHKDINPDNILIVGEGEGVKIFDLSLATQLQEEQQEITHSGLLEGTIPYISPEQTTRMNRPIDRRTDLYSLGITFYEMLVGKLPFNAKDTIEWVHCHIAKEPPPPHKISSDIPEMLSAIILKLLSKSADDRYATAFGLKKDLETALIEWQKNHNIPKFELGTNDPRNIFQIPQKLYGREKEAQLLMEIFDDVSHGNRELLLISGYTGIGKSFLVNEVQKPIVKKHGYFISGKYEVYKRDVPYIGLIQAFRNLINQILAGDKQRIEAWHDEINKALSPNAQVIIDVIPELEKLIGKQPPVIELPPAESKTRFELVFFDFVSIFAKREHPLVIFIDDLQWADSGSFNLFTQLMKSTDLKYFLLIGAYRDNEVNQTHPLFTMLDDFEKSSVIYKEIKLAPLSEDTIAQLVSDTLHTPEKNIEGLIKLILDKTAGNPYFVNLFLTTLYKTKKIKFDEMHGWIFDIDDINKMSITDNVVALLISEIGKLSQETQELLKISTCIGNEFDLKSLIELTGKPPEEITSLLWPALKEKWIIQLGESFKQITRNAYYDDKIAIRYKFSHDNVKQSLYSLMDSATREKIHYKLGKHLLQDYKKDHEEDLFIITQHFNQCLPLIQDKKEQFQIAEIFYHAANKMKLSISYDMAIKHYNNALLLLGDGVWEENYKLALDIYNNLAISEYLSGAFDKAKTLFDETVKRAKTPIEKAKILDAYALAYSAQSQMVEAARASEEGLHILGVNIPKRPSKFLLLITMLKIKWHLRNKKVDDLLNLPVMQDPTKMMIMELLHKLANSTIMVAVSDFAKPVYAIMLALLYSIKYGNHSSSAISYILFGQIEMRRNNIERAYQFSELSIKLCERYHNESLAFVYLLSIGRIFPWKLPYKDILVYANKAFDLSYETGQLTVHQYLSALITGMLYYSNKPLPEIDKKLKAFLSDPQCTCNDEIAIFLNSFQCFIQVLRGQRPEHDFNEVISQKKPAIYRGSNIFGTMSTKPLELNLAYFVQDWPKAMSIIHEIEETFLTQSSSFSTSVPAAGFYLIYGLTLLALYHQAPFLKRLLYRRKLKNVLAKFEFWTKHCPENYAAQYYLIKAGLAEINGNIAEVLTNYEKSFISARENDRIVIQAIAHEYIANCFLNRNQYRIARSFLQDAYAAYQQGGFGFKVNWLKNKFPQLFNIPDEATSSSSTKSSYHTSTVLDMDTVLKSAQTISSQMKLEKLLETLIGLVMENAGAQRGILLLMENNRLMVEAEGKVDAKPVILQKEPIESRHDFPLSVVQYVQNTQESIILGNASVNGSYTEDPYIVENKSLSIVCAPILHQNYLFGVIYLENNLVCEAFTKKHLELLKVLSSQIAISIENARLYSAYDQFIPHEFLDMLGKRSIIDICLGDNIQKEMSILFTDIRGFSKLSEALGPQEIFRFMNNYLGHMAPIIKNHGGFIDKYIGDAIMALFTDASSAVYAGIEMQKELNSYNQKLIEQGMMPIAIGIGINSGKLTLGTLGGLNRIETSVLSDAVNLAERIEELTKTYEAKLLISGTTYQQLNNRERFDLRFIERTPIRGMNEPIDVWEVFSADPDKLRYAKLAIDKHYKEAIDLYISRTYQKALNLFQRCLTNLPNDKVIMKYIVNCQKQLGLTQSENLKKSDEDEKQNNKIQIK